MNIVIRTDASVEIGTGHVMRCLTLAQTLREKDAKVSFICRELSGNLSRLIEDKGFKVYRLPFEEDAGFRSLTKISPEHITWLGVSWEIDAKQTQNHLREQDFNLLVVDHYALDCRWETQTRRFVKRIMVIDDLANRPHDCDLLLDQNLYPNQESCYKKMVPNYCKLFLGPKYALLRPEFIIERKKLRKRDGSITRVFIFFGGNDPTNETVKALNAFKLLNRPDIAVDVVVGGANPHKELIKRLIVTLPNVTLHCQTKKMARLMAKADLGMGAGGSTTWERCFMGLPSIITVLAQNQSEVAAAVAAAGAAINLGWKDNVDAQRIAGIIKHFTNHPDSVLEMEKRALQLMGNFNLDAKNPVIEAVLGDRNEEA